MLDALPDQTTKFPQFMRHTWYLPKLTNTLASLALLEYNRVVLVYLVLFLHHHVVVMS